MTKKTKDTSKCKEWERQRRDRLNTAFDGLAQLLPFYDPAKTMTKIDILEKSTQFIKEIRLTNSRLLVDKCQPQETGKKVHQLQEEVNKLIIRVRQLTALLKQANITIPLGPSIKLLGRKRRKWSSKLISQEIENADPSKGSNISKRRKAISNAKTKYTARKNNGTTASAAGSPTATAEKEAASGAVEPATKRQVDFNETDHLGEGDARKDQTATDTSKSGASKDRGEVLPATVKSDATSSSSKSVAPLTLSKLQNAQPIISTGMPVTINLSSTLTPVTFSGQIGFPNLSLQQLRPTIFLTTPITCSLPQTSSSLTKSNDASLNILPKLIVPSCSLQKIPIKCIRKPLPRKKFKPRGNSKKRLELLAKKACEASRQAETEANGPVGDSTEPDVIKEHTVQPRSPSPELIDISKDIEDDRPQVSSSNTSKQTTVEETLAKSQPAECAEEKRNGGESDVTTEKLPKISEIIEGEPSAIPDPDKRKTVSKVQSTSPLSTPPTSKKSNASNDQSDDEVNSVVEITVRLAPELDKNAVEVQEALCSTSVDSKNKEPTTLTPREDEVVTLQQQATAKSQPSELVTSAEELASTSNKANQVVQNAKQDKTASKAAAIPAAPAQNSSDLGRLLEEEDVSLSSEDKISECIARSIGLIDEHPVCSSELMELTTEWTSVVNSHLAAKSPISPTQMFLSMFPLLPRDSLLGDNVFGQKTGTGLLGCGRPSFAINSVLLENETVSGSATPNSEPILTGLDTTSYSWSQPPLGESSSAQSKFSSIFTPQRPNKRSATETKSQEAVYNPKPAKQSREDKQSTAPGSSYIFTALQPVATSTSLSRKKITVTSGQQSNEEVQPLKQFQLPPVSSDVPSQQSQSKNTANKRNRKSSTSKANSKASEAASKDKAPYTTTSSHSETGRTNPLLPLQSPPERQPHAQPRPFVITSPKGRACEKVSHFMPFRNSAQQRSSSSFSPSSQTKKSFGDTFASPPKSSTSTSFLPSLSNPNLPFELFRPAISSFATSSSVHRRKDGENDAHGGGQNQFLVHSQPSTLLDQPSQYTTRAYEDGHGAVQSAPPRFQQSQGSGNYAVTTSQCNQPQTFQLCEPVSGGSKPPPQSQNTSSYGLDLNSTKPGQKPSKPSQHLPFYLPEPSFQKRNDRNEGSGFVHGSHRSECTIGANYAYQQQGPSTSTQTQGASQNQQPMFFVQPPVQAQSLYQPVAVSSAPSASRHPAAAYNQAYNSSSQSSSMKSGHSQNYFDQPNALAQYPSSVHPQQHSDNNSRTLADSQPQHCANADNSSANTSSRFAPPFVNQRHPTVNWMTDPSGTDYGNMTTASSSKKASLTSSHSSHNPFSVSTLMGSNASAAAAGNDGYCTEAIIRKTQTSSNWNNFQGNPAPPTSQIAVSKPEVSVGSVGARNPTIPNYNAPFQPAPAHSHHHQQPQSSPQSHSHVHSHFAGGSQFSYFENPSLSMDHGTQLHYLSTPAPVTTASTSTPQIFLQSAPHPDSHAHGSHSHQQHGHHCQQQSSHSHPSSSSSVTNFNLSTIFPEINDKRLTSSNTSSYNVSGGPGGSGQDHRHGGSQAHSHSNHHPGGNSGNPQQQQQTNANQANNFSYFVNNLTPK